MLVRANLTSAVVADRLQPARQAMNASPSIWTGGTEFFPGIPVIKYEGPETNNPLAFRWYDEKRTIAGKPMKDWCRFSAAYWHSMRANGTDPFGSATLLRLWEEGNDNVEKACRRVRVFFEFLEKARIGYFAFHDADIAPRGGSLAESNDNLDQVVAVIKAEMKRTGIKCLWGTCNLFSDPVFMHGASTSCNLDAFVFAAARIRKMLDIAKELDADGFVFWGGREGYETLWNTDMKMELENFATLLKMAVAYKKEIGFTGQFYIEPKAMEPTKHQYDFDAAAVVAFLLRHGLDKDFMLNLETNHATLARHTMRHEMEYAAINGVLGSLDVNFGDFLLGWDVDKFLTDRATAAEMMLVVLQNGGLGNGKGGCNFDAKLRRPSTDPADMFHAHIGAMDCIAQGLLIAEQMVNDGIDVLVADRYASWSTQLGKDIRAGRHNLQTLEALMLKQGSPKPCVSGREELWENVVNGYLDRLK